MQREDVERVWPERLKIRDTGLHDDLGGPGQRIYTTAGRGYERVEYVRADLYAAIQAEIAALIHDIERAKEQHTHLLSERDAAYAAGQRDMQERAADTAAEWHCRTCGAWFSLEKPGCCDDPSWDGPRDALEMPDVIRALPIKDHPT